MAEGRADLAFTSAAEPTPPPRRKSSTLRVDVGLAQSKATNSSTPAFSLIPATPAPEISPMRLPDTAGLYPTRPPLLQSTNTAVQDLGDADWWGTMKETVFGEGCWQLAFIAALFTIQGNLQYVASGNLSVPVFQLAYQLKVSRRISSAEVGDGSSTSVGGGQRVLHSNRLTLISYL